MVSQDIEIVHQDFSKKNVAPKDDIKARWWFEKEDQIARSVFNVVRRIEGNQRVLWREFLTFAQLYENLDTFGYVPSFIATSLNYSGAAVTGKLTFNIVKSCIDAATAKIAKNKPAVEFSTENADYAVQKKAERLTQFIKGIFYSGDVYRIAQDVFRDACVTGTGVIKIYVEPYTNKISFDRVFITELVVDQTDAIYGKPKQIHHRKNADRDQLLAHYGDDEAIAEKITTAPTVLHAARSAADQIEVIESWHLPSKPGAADGKHTICIDNCTLLEEPYDKPNFPFVFFRWCKKSAGFFGMGLTEELAGIQLRINKLLKMINVAQEFMCVPRVFVEEGSNVSSHKAFDFGVLKFRGQPPVFNTAPAMSGEVYQFLETLYQKAYAISGVSLLSAAAQKPAGLNSGAAQREFMDINTERFAIQADQWQQMFLDIARIVIDLARDLFTNDKQNLEVRAKNGKFVKSIKWTDVDLEEDQYVMEAFPISGLPASPEGRLSYVQELSQAGLLDRETTLQLLQIPDIENEMSLKNSPIELVQSMIAKILEDGEPQEPNSFMNLQKSKELVVLSYNQAQLRGASEANLDLLEDFSNKIETLINSAKEQAAPPPQAQPMAVPQAPPQSDLLPNVPA